MTLSEAKAILEGITVDGKTLQEHLEVINHKEAIHYIEEIIINHEELLEWQMKNIHSIILKGILPENAGVYRKGNVFISKHISPEYIQVLGQMTELIKWVSGETPLPRSALDL